MKKTDVILAVDQGTTGTRAVAYDRAGNAAGSAYREFRQYYPSVGFVEHDGEEIWQSTVGVIRTVLAQTRLRGARIAAIGITNQRETTLLWDRQTGKPVSRAIVWQDRRTSKLCGELKTRFGEKIFRDRTGLILDPYFSGTKIAWLLEHFPGLRRKAMNGQIAFGTVDSWLLWKMTGGKTHATDMTNASRTLLYHLRQKKWDAELMKILKVPGALLPQVHSSGHCFGHVRKVPPLLDGTPITSMMGDQQAALFGQGCYRRGEAKNTYGTGCFIVVNAGTRYPKPPHGLITTLACDGAGRAVYALEGSVFIAGAAVQWLRDGLRLFRKASESEAIARSVSDNGGLTVVPAFVGLGSPYWNPEVRGMITGLTRGTRIGHLVRATLESIAHQTADVLDKIEGQTHFSIAKLQVDGGATSNRFLMQFQADLLGIPVMVAELAESTVWGAAKLAGKTSGFWQNLSKLDRSRRYTVYRPRMDRSEARCLRERWLREVGRLLSPSACPRA
jgi:glycerol kinase